MKLNGNKWDKVMTWELNIVKNEMIRCLLKPCCQKKTVPQTRALFFFPLSKKLKNSSKINETCQWTGSPEAKFHLSWLLFWSWDPSSSVLISSWGFLVAWHVLNIHISAFRVGSWSMLQDAKSRSWVHTKVFREQGDIVRFRNAVPTTLSLWQFLFAAAELVFQSTPDHRRRSNSQTSAECAVRIGILPKYGWLQVKHCDSFVGVRGWKNGNENGHKCFPGETRQHGPDQTLFATTYICRFAFIGRSFPTHSLLVLLLLDRHGTNWYIMKIALPHWKQSQPTLLPSNTWRRQPKPKASNETSAPNQFKAKVRRSTSLTFAAVRVHWLTALQPRVNWFSWNRHHLQAKLGSRPHASPSPTAPLPLER